MGLSESVVDARKSSLCICTERYITYLKPNGLLMLNVYREKADNLDMNAVLNEFILCGDEKRQNAFIHTC